MSDQLPPAPLPGQPYVWTPPSYGEPYQLAEAYQAPYGPTSVTAPPPEHRSRTGLWVSLAIGGLVILIGVAVGGIALLAHANDRPTRTLSIPTQFAHHDLVTGAVADDIKSRTQDSFLTGGFTATKLLGKPQIGVYDPMSQNVSDPTSAGQPAVIFVGFSAGGDPNTAEFLHSGTAQARVSLFLNGADGTTEYEPGPLGGSLACGESAGAIVCVWADSSTLGIAVFSGNGTQDEDVTDMVALRAAAER